MERILHRGPKEEESQRTETQESQTEKKASGEQKPVPTEEQVGKTPKQTRKPRQVKLKFHGSHFTFDDESGHREILNEEVFVVDEKLLDREAFKSLLENKGLEKVK